MSDAHIHIEVVTKPERCPHCRAALPEGVVGFAPKGSRTEAMMELAEATLAKEAAEEKYGSSDGWPEPHIPGGVLDLAYKAYSAALAAAREHT